MSFYQVLTSVTCREIKLLVCYIYKRRLWCNLSCLGERSPRLKKKEKEDISLCHCHVNINIVMFTEHRIFLPCSVGGESEMQDHDCSLTNGVLQHFILLDLHTQAVFKMLII